MFFTRSYGRKKRLHKRTKAPKSKLKGVSPSFKHSKRHVKLQFWLWRKRKENCILAMFRAERQTHKNSSFSNQRLTFKTKKNGITETLESTDVTISQKSNFVNGEEVDLSADLIGHTAAHKTVNEEDTNFISNSECLLPVKADVKLTIDKGKNKTPRDLTSHHLNITTKKLEKAVQEFLVESHRKYGSFIPLEMGDMKKHLKNKFNKDFKDMDRMILGITKQHVEKLRKPNFFFQVVYKKHTVTLDDLLTLAEENWLNDQVINMYGELIMESAHCKVHFMNSFFHRQLITKGYEGVRRWTKRVDLFSKRLLLVPVHLEVHWCLVTADLNKKKICLYDSQGNGLQKVARNILKYLLNEAKERKLSAFESGWTVSSNEEIPQQTNENDCGVFVLEYSRCLALSEPLQFSQNDIPKIRRRIYKELCECKLHEKM